VRVVEGDGHPWTNCEVRQRAPRVSDLCLCSEIDAQARSAMPSSVLLFRKLTVLPGDGRGNNIDEPKVYCNKSTRNTKMLCYYDDDTKYSLETGTGNAFTVHNSSFRFTHSEYRSVELVSELGDSRSNCQMER
jgi:hypothetical protein